MSNYEIIFVVLVYKNYNDLEDFYNSIKQVVNFSYKVVVIESFFTNEMSEKIKEIAYSNNSDYICVENRGYGYGNNIGLKISVEKYKSRYTIISNPDIIINKLDINELNKTKFDVMGPKIIRKDGKNQNPMYIKENYNNTYFLGYISKHHSKLLFYIYIIVYKISNLINKRAGILKVYALHGSFLIFNTDFIKYNLPLFDDNMFLFCEEHLLAYKFKKKNSKVIYNPNLIVYHKEDGSINLSNKDINSLNKILESYKYFFENYIVKG